MLNVYNYFLCDLILYNFWINSAFTERALAIISIIYGQYTQNEEDEQRKEDTRKDEQIDDNTLHLTPICKEEEEHTSEDNRLCNNINHAERLLLNHGYLRDAITTENNLFLKNETVKTILNRKWYGTAKINLLTVSIINNKLYYCEPDECQRLKYNTHRLYILNYKRSLWIVLFSKDEKSYSIFKQIFREGVNERQ